MLKYCVKYKCKYSNKNFKKIFFLFTRVLQIQNEEFKEEGKHACKRKVGDKQKRLTVVDLYPHSLLRKKGI